MDEAERAFRDALHRVDTIPVPLRAVARTRATPPRPRPRGAVRWLAAAAAFVVVAALAAWAVLGRQPVPAVPMSTPSATAATNPLLGTTWMVSSLYGRMAKYAPDKVPFLQFEADGTFLGGDPCNRLDGTYLLLGGRSLRLFPGAMTEIACNVDQQASFLRAVTQARQFQRDGDVLSLVGPDAEVLATLSSSALFVDPTPSVPAATPTNPDEPVSNPVTPSAGPGPDSHEPVTQVLIRLRNDSAVGFTGIRAVFPDGLTVDYGHLPAGTASNYVVVTEAYRYTFLQLTAGGKELKLQPIDYVGESLLAPGRYTYALTLEDGHLQLGFETD